MTIVQQSRPIADPIARWWADVHDTAVQFERILTPDPETTPQALWAVLMTQLQTMVSDLKRIPHTRVTSDAHQNLLHATDYLYRCYEQLTQANTEEAIFYYNNALLQVTHLHQFLVDNGLTI
jgi:hypothetical protein